MNNDGIALAHKGDQPLQLGPLHVFPGRLVHKHAISCDLFKLASGILIETADSNVTNAVTVQGKLQGQSVRLDSMILRNKRQLLLKETLY